MEKLKTYIIYQVTNKINGKIYIGRGKLKTTGGFQFKFLEE